MGGGQEGAAGEDPRMIVSYFEKNHRYYFFVKEALSDAESQLARMEVGRRGLEGDQQRLHGALEDKESEARALRAKCDSLTRGVAALEDKCSGLAATVDGLNSQLERSAQNEGELQVVFQCVKRNYSIF